MMENPSSLLKTGGSASLNIGTYTADQTGQASIDCLGFEYALVVMVFGAVGSGGGADINIYSSDDDGSSDAFAAISGASYSTTGTEDNSILLGEIRLSNKERYLKAYLDETTTGSSTVVGVFIVPMTSRASATYSLGTYEFSVM